VRSLAAALRDSDQERVRVVIFDGDFPPGRSRDIAEVRAEYAQLFSAGLLTIVERNKPPGIAACGEMAAWQRKQTLDAVELIAACGAEGDYYLHLEDDVISAPGCIASIDAAVAAHAAAGRQWAILSFYNSFPVEDGTPYSEYSLAHGYFGFIGQVFHWRDLEGLRSFLRDHCAEGPLDLLAACWARVTGGAVIAHAPSLFQHAGVLSSFQNQIQLWSAPQFVEEDAAREERLTRDLRDIETYHPSATAVFLRYRRALQSGEFEQSHAPDRAHKRVTQQ